jgi:hypothetical protein
MAGQQMKTKAELESDARKAVADFNKAPRGAFLLGLSNWVNLHLAGSRGKDKALYQQHRTIQ